MRARLRVKALSPGRRKRLAAAAAAGLPPSPRAELLAIMSSPDLQCSKLGRSFSMKKIHHKPLFWELAAACLGIRREQTDAVAAEYRRLCEAEQRADRWQSRSKQQKQAQQEKAQQEKAQQEQAQQQARAQQMQVRARAQQEQMQAQHEQQEQMQAQQQEQQRQMQQQEQRRGEAAPAAQLVLTAEEAEAAVTALMAAPEVAIACKAGPLQKRNSPVSLQLYAPPADPSTPSRCFVFELSAMRPEVRAAAVRHLTRLLESAGTIKVLHDCRYQCETLWHHHRIRVSPMWDTQVAFAFLQHVSSMGGGAGAKGVDGPIGLSQLLQRLNLPPTDGSGRTEQAPHRFEPRSLEPQMLQCTVGDVCQLLAAKVRLAADLGPVAASRVTALSSARADGGARCLQPADRRSAVDARGSSGSSGRSGSLAGALQPQLGKVMQLSIEAPGYLPRYSLELGDAKAAQGEEGRVRQPAPTAATKDPETQQMLKLFPKPVRSAMRAALQAEEKAVQAAAATTAAAAAGDQGAGKQGGSAGRGSSGVDGARAGVQLVEVTVDMGRPPRLRLSSRKELELEVPFTVEDALAHLGAAQGRLNIGDGSPGDLFYSDNRAGIPGTLHRISAMRDRRGGVIGLTYRVGRHVPGAGGMIVDILHAIARGHDATGHEVQGAVSPSLLLLGAPGTGKTTLLRDVANILSTNFNRQVVIVDTSNEVAGDGCTPHSCIGTARRMMVPNKHMQHTVMIEAVQNHNPEVVVIDEIGSPQEVTAAKSIAHRGVVLVGTAHGRNLGALIRNADLNGLIGGITTVTLGDDEARRTNRGQKTRTERQGEPAFSTLVEVLSRNCWRVHMSVARSVDAILAGREPPTQLRWVEPDGRLMVRLEGQPAGSAAGGGMRMPVKQTPMRLGMGGGRWFQDLLELAAQR